MTASNLWLAAGLRTPFAKVDGALAAHDAIDLSVPVVKAMLEKGARPDFAVWGTVIPNLTWSNIAREVLLDAGADPTIPAFSTVMACSTSMAGVLEAAGMIDGRGRDLALVGGVEAMSRVQIGLSVRLSDWIRRFQQARDLKGRLAVLSAFKAADAKLFIPKVANRTTGLSMGEHTEITAKEWGLARADQDAIAFASHQNAVRAWESGFFDDLVIPIGEARRDTIPRKDSTLEKLAKLKSAFDKTSGQGTLTAGNSSPLTDGASSIWVASEAGLARLPERTPRVKILDYEVTAIDLRNEGLLMAPAYGVPRMLARNGLTLGDIGLWEIHEAFAAQVLSHIAAWESRKFLAEKAGVTAELGAFPRERMNPTGGSLAIGHPFGATGARILSQATKELAARGKGEKAIVSICADGGQGTMMLLEAA
ncbi:acetyl-CoA C-acyltransferase [Caulobacter sp. D4A]|uniref:acetyl-CoA C-acyltransferase n=1 Tax=unclassified Caulobacter TaxID=2648921 RepID=UPI000D7369B4|nr:MULTISPECIES: acetyl-CoA C-acyltransferase [unclassified Caulobacter]PXA82712.1 acetyl-CoA C-acyltransferase [Caulobacter sp. D4A]PXA94499.1 acetyl-CoA C-acyltransferase [Caulobacter sp. D5]